MWGRVVALVCSLLIVYGLYLLTRKLVSERVANWSAFIYAVVPLNIYYGRAFMPESMMLMSIVFGIYFFSEWIDDRRWSHFILSAVFISLSILIKIPTLYIGLPLLYLAYQKYGKKVFTDLKLLLYAVIVLLPVTLWYWHAHNLFLAYGLSFGIWGFGVDKWGNFGLLIQPAFYNDIIFKSIAERHLTYAGFIPFIVGLFVKREKESERMFDWWLVSLVIYFLIVSGGNRAHEYYQLPFVLPAAVFTGKAFAKYLDLAKIRESFSAHKLRYVFFALCLLLIPVLSFLRVYNFWIRETYDGTDFKLADAVKSNSLKDELVITVSNFNPVYLYLSGRKGWATVPEKIDTLYISGKIKEGAGLLAGDKSYFVSSEGKENLMKAIDAYKLVKDDKDYFVIKLRKEE